MTNASVPLLSYFHWALVSSLILFQPHCCKGEKHNKDIESRMFVCGSDVMYVCTLFMENVTFLKSNDVLSSTRCSFLNLIKMPELMQTYYYYYSADLRFELLSGRQ